MSKKSSPPSTDTLIQYLLQARETAISLNETMALYLIGMAIKAVEDRQGEGVPPGWDDGVTEDDDEPPVAAALPAA